MNFRLKFDKNFHAPHPTGQYSITAGYVIAGIIFALLCAYFLFIPEQKTITDQTLKVGDIVKEDIIIKKNFMIEDSENTDENRRLALQSILPVYEFNPEIQAQSEAEIKYWFTFIREAREVWQKNPERINEIQTKLHSEFGIKLEKDKVKLIIANNIFGRFTAEDLLKFLQDFYRRYIVASKAGAEKSKAGSIRLQPAAGASFAVIKLDDISDLESIRSELFSFLRSRGISSIDTELAASILMEFIHANTTYSLNITQQEQQKAIAQVNPVMTRLKSGKVILRKGDEISTEDMKIIRKIFQEETKHGNRLPRFWLIFTLVFLMVIFGRYLFKYWKYENINKRKIFLVLGLTLLVSAVCYRVCLFIFPLILQNLSIPFEYGLYTIWFAIPFAFGALIITFIYDTQIAIIYSFLNSIFAALICDWNLNVALYAFFGSLAVSFAIEYFQRIKRSPIFKSSLTLLLLMNVFFITILSVAEKDLPLNLTVNLIMGIFSALATPVLASFIIPLWEIIFKLVTDLKLIELSNLNLPIFREMLEKAPGTYHHSQMVASLSEAAALDLGLSPQLLTCMALYHDIGKIDSPEIFTENQNIYSDPHVNMTPVESARYIIAHISNGIERANQLKLPDVIKSSISEHHGAKLVRFFYEKALGLSTVDADGFDDKVFRYPGDKPKTIENAIIMLADQVEAASKSLATPSDDEIRNVVEKIIVVNIEESQFIDCEGLTFKALNIIASSFHRKLASIYHMRVSYPGFNFKEEIKDEPKQKE